ncbi:MAG: hypothetical protein C6I01_00905 [Epsilonproteobacteria bacterium]|nr:hypothetical protein [Campylobacterota bacterium]
MGVNSNFKGELGEEIEEGGKFEEVEEVGEVSEVEEIGEVSEVEEVWAKFSFFRLLLGEEEGKGGFAIGEVEGEVEFFSRFFPFSSIWLAWVKLALFLSTTFPFFQFF